MRTLPFTLIALLLATLGLCAQPDLISMPKKSKPSTPAAAQSAIIKTTKGDITVEFWSDVAPETVKNFQKLAREGFYDGTCFHRIVKGFMIQGGDPLTKDETQKDMWGTGGPGYMIKAEFNTKHHSRGVLSMARSSNPDSAGSQFFICLDDAGFLDGQYTAFGQVIAGEDVLMAIGNTPTQYGSSSEKSSPMERIGVVSVKLGK